MALRTQPCRCAAVRVVVASAHEGARPRATPPTGRFPRDRRESGCAPFFVRSERPASTARCARRLPAFHVALQDRARRSMGR